MGLLKDVIRHLGGSCHAATPALPLVGVSTEAERGCQSHDRTLADGYDIVCVCGMCVFVHCAVCMCMCRVRVLCVLCVCVCVYVPCAMCVCVCYVSRVPPPPTTHMTVSQRIFKGYLEGQVGRRPEQVRVNVQQRAASLPDLRDRGASLKAAWVDWWACLKMRCDPSGCLQRTAHVKDGPPPCRLTQACPSPPGRLPAASCRPRA